MPPAQEKHAFRKGPGKERDWLGKIGSERDVIGEERIGTGDGSWRGENFLTVGPGEERDGTGNGMGIGKRQG